VLEGRKSIRRVTLGGDAARATRPSTAVGAITAFECTCVGERANGRGGKSVEEKLSGFAKGSIRERYVG
jgi:hypothetical protein